MINRSTAVSIMQKSRTPKTIFDKMNTKIQKAIVQAAKNGCGRVSVETGGLERTVRKEITRSLIDLGFRVKWHDINDYDDERVIITWEFV